MAIKEYGQLLDYYRSMLELFDDIHFNSSVSEELYKRNLRVGSSELIPITHSQVRDNRVLRSFESQTLYLIFIGSTNTYKGFPLLREVLRELHDEGYQNWQLDVWGAAGGSKRENIRCRGLYHPDELPKIFKEDSLLIVPSVWYETFSLITLEALSFATPTLVSATVGAKDLVAQYDPWFVFSDKTELKERLKTLLLDRAKLRDFNREVLTREWQHSIAEHSAEVLAMYRGQIF